MAHAEKKKFQNCHMNRHNTNVHIITENSKIENDFAVIDAQLERIRLKIDLQNNNNEQRQQHDQLQRYTALLEELKNAH